MLHHDDVLASRFGRATAPMRTIAGWCIISRAWHKRDDGAMTASTEAARFYCAVIYAVGTPSGPGTEVAALRTYVTCGGWSLVDILFDRYNTAHPADSPGLCAALDRLRLGFAVALVLDHVVYIGMPELSWLNVVVWARNGSLYRIMPTADERVIADGRPSAATDARLAVRLGAARLSLRGAG